MYVCLCVCLLLLLEGFDAEKAGRLGVDLLVDQEVVVAVDKLPPGLEGLELVSDAGGSVDLLERGGELALVLVAVLLELGLAPVDDDAPFVELVVDGVGHGTIVCWRRERKEKVIFYIEGRVCDVFWCLHGNGKSVLLDGNSVERGCHVDVVFVLNKFHLFGGGRLLLLVLLEGLDSLDNLGSVHAHLR